VLAGAFTAGAAVTVFMLFWFGLIGSEPYPLMWLMPAAAGALITAGLAVCVCSALSVEKKVRMHSRYTFADIQLKFAVLSIYGGIYNIDGENAVWRTIYYIPFSDFVSAQPSANGRKIIVNGRIREYSSDSDHLGYHIRNGSIEFDRMWFEHSGFTELSAAEFPAMFGDPRKLCDALNEAKKRFDELPKPKPYVFREAEHIRRRPKPRLMPNDMWYDRRK